MLERHAKGQGMLNSSCTRSQFGDCAADAWGRMLEDLKHKAVEERIDTVNTVMNRARYVTDMANWGVQDYWGTPSEFFWKDGDCEDYAIAKYLSLRALGFPEGALRVVVVEDLNLKVAHAVLVVWDGDGWLLLDNQIRQVIAATSIRHYRPIYSLNETAWWLHQPSPSR